MRVVRAASAVVGRAHVVRGAPMARTVTDAAALRASYETDGYAIARGVVPLDLVAEMRAHVDFLRARYPTIPTEHLHHLILRNDPFWTRVCAEPALVELARAFAPFLSDGNVALFSSHYFHKQPRTGAAVLWHQDGAYWPLRPMNVLTLWVAVTESDRGNGCLRVVRGTHTAPLGELRPDRSVHNVLGSATHSDADVAALGWADRVVDLELAPGDVSIHHPNVVHGSAANTSDRARCGLTIRYISASTACTDPEQPVMMMAGQAVPGVNAYRSWPRYRPGHDMPFRGCETWNARRRVNPDDEAYFARTDFAAMDAEIRAGLDAFIDKLGGRAPAP